MTAKGTAPEQGQIVKLRHKIWAVTAVNKTKTQSTQAIHRVALECLSDDALGENIQVIWEREIAPHFVESTSSQAMMSQRFLTRSSGLCNGVPAP
jgi:hypothetical protein